MFLTNNSPDLCVLTLCIKIRQNDLYWASLPRISVNSNENCCGYNFQALANISGNFPEILNFRKIYNPRGLTGQNPMERPRLGRSVLTKPVLVSHHHAVISKWVKVLTKWQTFEVYTNTYTWCLYECRPLHNNWQLHLNRLFRCTFLSLSLPQNINIS